jgi:thermitase
MHFLFKNIILINIIIFTNIILISPVRADYCVKKIPVAVIDTGVDPDHEDISEYLWHDPKVKNMYGWDFVNEAKKEQKPIYDEAFNEEVYSLALNLGSTGKMNPIDIHGHGTHIAGIILQQTKCALIMPIKYYSENSPGPLSLKRSISSLKFAIKHKAKIINYSGGGPEFVESEYNVLKKAEKAGILVIVAAGNEGKNIDPLIGNEDNAYYPANYHLSNIISVASVDRGQEILPSSNYGIDYVDLGALGDDVMSSVPNHEHASMTGTSQATAEVSGIAAAIWAKNPSLTAKQVKDIILGSVIKVNSLRTKIKTGGVANLTQSLFNTPKSDKKPFRAISAKTN